MPSKVSNHCSSMFKMSAGVSIIIKLSVFVADAAEKNELVGLSPAISFCVVLLVLY